MGDYNLKIRKMAVIQLDECGIYWYCIKIIRVMELIWKTEVEL